MWNFLSRFTYFFQQRFSHNEENITTPNNVCLDQNIEQKGSTSIKKCICCDGTGLKPYCYDIEKNLPSRFGEMEEWESSRKCPVCKGSGYTCVIDYNQNN
jgi:hypothetical protein